VCRNAAAKDKPALDTRTNEVWCISLAGPGVSHVIPIGHPDKRTQLHRADVFEALHPLFWSERTKINQNVGFDLLSISKYYGGELPPPPYADVMTMVFLINENLKAYNLGFLSQHYLGYTYSEKLGEKAYTAPWNDAMKYSLVDSKMAWMLWWKLSPVLGEKPKLGALFDLEMEVLQVLLQMRRQGAFVDIEGFRTLRPQLEAQLAEIGGEIKREVDPIWDWPTKTFNMNSTQHLAHLLYDLLGLPCLWQTETGQRSTAAGAIKSLARRHPVPRQILRYKDVNKLLSTYVAGFLPCIDNDSRIRASLNQAVARTGRLSCSAPNLQNIPARWKETADAQMIRRLFVAPPGRMLIVADYSQIELRVLAHQTKDRLLMYAYTHDQDLHTQTASLIYKVPQDEVTVEQRATAKNCNFNFSFEGGPNRVVELSGISRTEAEKVYAAWHQAYPGVKKWGAEVKRSCLKNGYVETLYGRKRRLKDISSREPKDRSYAERQAVNHPIQGTAADIAKVAIIRVHKALREFHAALVLQIHDEFVIECDEGEVDDAIPFIKEAMEDIRLGDRPVLDVPLEANIGIGSNWSAAK
jgi:DNA polymerase-1